MACRTDFPALYSSVCALHYVDWAIPTRRAFAGPRRARSLPQLGLGGAGAAVTTGTSSAPTCGVMATASGADGNYSMSAYSTTSHSSSISSRWRRSPLSRIRWAGTSACRYIRHLSRQGCAAGCDRRLGSVAQGDRRARPQGMDERVHDWGPPEEQRKIVRPACRAATPPSRTPQAHAGRERSFVGRAGRGTDANRGVNQNEDGTYS